MDDSLKSLFRTEELALAASLGLGDGDLKPKVLELFKQLPDPLLSAPEVRQLLGVSDGADAVSTALVELCVEGALEKSVTTTRPLDAEGVTLYRLKEKEFARLKLLAIESTLDGNNKRYQFTCDGRLIRCFSKVDRLDAVAGTGQQRSEIVKHVEQIAAGMSSGTQVPNSVLLVLSSENIAEDPEELPPESFIVIKHLSDMAEVPNPAKDDGVAQRIRTVEISIPFRNAAFDEEKSCLLVDGQQRTAALSKVDIDTVPELFLSVNAVVASPDESKRIFQIANSTVRISTEFSRALLATMEDAPGYLKKDRVRALAVKTLALDDATSPFHGLVQHPGVRSDKRPPIAFNSLFHIASQFSDGALPLDEDAAQLSQVVAKSFALVKATWPDAWGLKPKDSRLMHGAGLRAVSSLIVNHLDSNYRLYDFDLARQEVWDDLKASLGRLSSRIQWTADTALKGTATQKKIYLEEVEQRQNTNQDITALTSFLLKESTQLDKEAAKATKAGKK